MDAAGVFGNISANRAGRLAGRIGNIIKAVRRNRARKLRIYQTGLYARNPIGGVNVEHLPHSRELNNYPPIYRESSAGQSRAGAARREADPFAREHFDDLSSLFR